MATAQHTEDVKVCGHKTYRVHCLSCMALEWASELSVALAELAKYEHKVSVNEGILLDSDEPDDRKQRTLTELRNIKELRDDCSKSAEGFKTQLALANKEVDAFAAGMIKSTLSQIPVLLTRNRT